MKPALNLGIILALARSFLLAGSDQVQNAGALVGQTLTANPGSWGGKTPITFTYQWTRDGANIASATAATYLLVAADKNHVIGCKVTATNSTGNTTVASRNTHYPVN